MPIDPMTIIIFAVLALLIFFMFRNSRKRQKDMQNLQSKMVPGARVMTNFGLYGTILSIDEDENQVLLEAAPGTVLTLHRQTITRIVEDSPETVAADDAPTGEPEFGERLDTDGETRQKNDD